MRYFWIYLVLSLTLVAACKEDDMNDPTDGCNSDFDQQALYAQIADKLIINAYAEMYTAMQNLRNTTNGFLQSPSEIGLITLQEKWVEAAVAWQAAEPFEFGPAETVFLRNSLNNFPTDTAAIWENIQTGDFNPDQPDNYDKGLPALEYLLFGIGDEIPEIVNMYTDNADLRSYFDELVQDMEVRIETAYNGWVNGYRDSFVENTGNAAGTSLSQIVNQLNQHYEILKRDRIGIPSGVLTLGFTNPGQVEAPYSQSSIELALASLEGSRRFYEGNHIIGTEGTGLDDYLNYIGATKDGQPLDQLIQNQYDLAEQALQAISTPLGSAVDEETDLVEAAYIELSRLVILLKTDLPSVLCVSITYIDNPSDSD